MNPETTLQDHIPMNINIVIIGHPGSGKTHLASVLSAKAGIESIDIDALFDKHPFYAFSKKLYAKALGKLMQGKDSWIIDGYHVSLMPDKVWQDATTIIYLNLCTDELKQNIRTRYKAKKEARDFSHWQATRINTLKNYAQITLQDKALKKDVVRIKSLAADNSTFVEVRTRDEIQQFVKDFFREWKKTA